MRNACQGNSISASTTLQMNAEVTGDTPISRPTSMMPASKSSTTDNVIDRITPRKSSTGITYRRISPTRVAAALLVVTETPPAGWLVATSDALGCADELLLLLLTATVSFTCSTLNFTE